MKTILSIQSHVVYGHAGNSAAVFPMRRMGVNVWPLNTVQFSNHTQYGKWKGVVMPAEHLIEIVQGINDIQQLARCDAILSGYIGSPEQGQVILDIVDKIKQANPKAIYLCDPVMGHPEKGCQVASGVAEFFCESVIPKSNIMAPNFYELCTLSGKTVVDVNSAIEAAQMLCKKGPSMILVKHLGKAGNDKNAFEMLLVTEKHAWHISRPLIDFGIKQPVGVGDLTSGLFLSNILLGKSEKEALEQTTSAVYDVILTTYEMKEYELQIVAAQDFIVSPRKKFHAQQLI